ncbi:MAG: T9SS type A sorting domain-containing protein, partial [Bacteroidetes bacterium]|nr:T9SS type A sorting domain-containing protein [Bacteroidota bacterium]
ANHPNYFLGAKVGSMCDTVLSVQNIKEHDSNFQLFPNPVVNDEVTFTYNVLKESVLLILNNIEGQEVARFHLPQWSSVQHLKLPKLSSGIYLARLLGNHTSANVKFFVE